MARPRTVTPGRPTSRERSGTMGPMAAAERPSPQGGASIRWRLILGMLGLLAVALGIVGLTLFTLLRGQIDQRVVAELHRTTDEFRVLAEQGVDPETRQRFTSPNELLRVSLQRTVLAPTEGFLGYVDGQLRWLAPDGVPLRPEDDPQLLAHLAPLVTGTDDREGTLSTDAREYKYYVAPVRFAGNDSTGALVRVTNMDGERTQLNTMMRTYLMVSIASLVIASAIVAVWVRRLLRPIGWLRQTAARITEEDLSERVPVRGHDELAALASTVNQMLDRIEKGVTSQKNLLDDVGHELRTPVTVVRGHLELMDIDDPADVRATRAVALDELDRMGGLVNDLLTLAKAGQPDFVHLHWTELAPLTDGVLTRARMLGERRWTMSRVADADARLDPERITQAWLQLVANAVQYSEDGSTIDIGSRVTRGEVYLWVSDQGIGIAPEELEVVRARFGRAAGVRGRVEGSGLGLSIVDSIAEAHGGRLTIDSTPGAGSTFTMILPMDPT